MRRATARRLPGGSIPASAGIGLRAPHVEAFLAQVPPVPWLEVHSENYFCHGSAAAANLTRIRDSYALSMHGVGLSLGSTDPLDKGHLRKLRDAIHRYEPALVSEHLAWGSVAGLHVNDFLPLPYNLEALEHLTNRVDAVQDFIGRRILIENISSYFQFNEADMPEHAFLVELVRRSGCGILLDVNNLYVNERNHGDSALTFLNSIPFDSVDEIHLAGHSIQHYDGNDLAADTHDAAICDDVWTLYDTAVRRFGRVPTLIEWDSDLPALEVLIAEMLKAETIMEAADDLAA